MAPRKRRPTRVSEEAQKEFIRHVKNLHRRRYDRSPMWRGVKVIKSPLDIALYSSVIYEKRPKFIIETGTKFGGSALFFGDMLQLFGGHRVFTIDINGSQNFTSHPHVEYIQGSSVDPDLFRELRGDLFGKGDVMVVLDSDHSKDHVFRELQLYSQIVTPNQYMVVEDCWGSGEKPRDPYRAVEEFLKHSKAFERRPVDKNFIFSVTRDGWLLRER